MDQNAELKESKRILTLLRTYQSVRVQHDIFHSADFEVDYNTIRVMTEKDLLSDHLASDYFIGYVSHDFPATTWQMFKRTHENSWWLGWLVRRRPVMYTTWTGHADVKVDRYLGYPDAVINNKRLGRAIVFETTEQVYTED